MDDAVRMEVLEGVDDLDCVALHFKLMQPLSPLEQLIHALILAQFQQNVDVFRVLKEVLELADMVMLDAPMYLDLTHQLLLGTTFSKTRLLDYLGRMDVISVGIDELPAFGKATLS